MTCHKELRRITPNPQDKHAMEKGKRKESEPKVKRKSEAEARRQKAKDN